MKYLSDEIFIDLYEPQELNKYVNYRIWRESAPNKGFTELVFTGRMYISNTSQRVYLNDIINSYVYDHKYIRPQSTALDLPSATENPTGVLQRFQIELVESGSTYTTDTILSMYQNPMSTKGHYISLLSQPAEIDNILTQNTNLLPRIPNPAIKDLHSPMNMWFGAMVICNKQLLTETADTAPNFSIYNVDAQGQPLANLGLYKNSDHIITPVVSGSDLVNNRSVDAKYIMVAGEGKTGLISPIKVAEYDNCPAEYYLIWMDRSGGYQCQPFSKRNTYSETIDSKSIVNMISQERQYEKVVTNKWDLNSDWLSFEQKDAFESILVSPYLYLYNTELNKGFWVLCRESEWVQSNKHNQKRPFNFKITLESIKKQNIIY